MHPFCTCLLALLGLLLFTSCRSVSPTTVDTATDAAYAASAGGITYAVLEDQDPAVQAAGAVVGAAGGLLLSNYFQGKDDEAQAAALRAADRSGQSRVARDFYDAWVNVQRYPTANESAPPAFTTMELPLQSYVTSDGVVFEPRSQTIIIPKP